MIVRFYLVLALVFSTSAFSQFYNEQMMQAMENLTSAIYDLKNDTTGLRELGSEFLVRLENLTSVLFSLKTDASSIKDSFQNFTKFLTEQWPQASGNLDKLAKLPESISAVVTVINHSMSIVEKCSITLGVCMVSTAVIYITGRAVLHYLRVARNKIAKDSNI